MNRVLRPVAFTCTALLLATVHSLAQNLTCPEVVQTALEATSEACDNVGRNQVCYGNITLEAESQQGAEVLNFDTPGDVVDITDVKTLSLNPLDRSANVWGVALMKIQASLPDTLPGQNVTILLFGDVEIANAVGSNVEPITIDIRTTSGANIRRNPSTEAAILSSVQRGTTLIADGRLEDNSWVRVLLPDGSGTGWISAELIIPDSELNLLDTVESGSIAYGPMQAFYFQTGVNDAPCDEAPDSGIMIQTPSGAGRITFQINDVEIKLGSTIYLQAQPAGAMTVSVIENSALITSQGVTQFAPAGTRVHIPLDENGLAAEPPTPPEPYDYERLSVLPVDNLERTIVVPRALTQQQIDSDLETATSDSSSSGRISPGGWTVTYSIPPAISGPCTWQPQGAVPSTENFTLSIASSGETITVAGGWYQEWTPSMELYFVSENAGALTFSGTAPIPYGQRTLFWTFTSPTTVTGTSTTSQGACSFAYSIISGNHG